MNYQQVIKTKEFLLEGERIPLDNPKEINQYAKKIALYFNEDKFLNKLRCCNIVFDMNSYESSNGSNDLDLIKSYLQRLLDNTPNLNIFNNIYSISLKIKSLKSDDYNSMIEIIREVYSGFSNTIAFDKNIEKLATFPGNGIQARTYCPLDKNVMNGVLIKLETLANDLLNPQKTKDTNPKVLIQNNNYNSLNNNIDVSAEIDNAYKNLEKAALSPQEEEKTKQEIEELKKLLESKEDQISKWNKFKQIAKGIGDYSLQAAQIIAPLMIALWPK